MATTRQLEDLLYVERGHTSNFEEWEKKATHPLAKMIFRMAADKEANHIRWVELLIEMSKAGERGEELGVNEGELRFWIDDEAGEGDQYQKRAEAVDEPWVRAALEQMGHDETTNAQMLQSLLESVSASR
jgi:rubrerythrin